MRNTFFNDGRFRIVRGTDHALGEFLQLFDEEAEDADVDDIVLDWDEFLGYNINKTGIESGTPLERAKAHIKNSYSIFEQVAAVTKPNSLKIG